MDILESVTDAPGIISALVPKTRVNVTAASFGFLNEANN